MNWQGGLFRLWVAGSIAWIAIASWITYRTVIIPREIKAAERACFDARVANPGSGNPTGCWTPENMFADLIPISSIIQDYALLALGPVIAVAALWFICNWIAAGFTRPTT